MTRLTPWVSILFLAGLTTFVGPVPLLANDGEPAARDILELTLTTQAQEPQAVSVQMSTYSLSVSPKGQASMLTLRIAGPGRTLLLDERTGGDSIDWSLPGSAPDGSYRYEAYVTTSGNGEPEGHLTPGGFEVHHGQIVQP